MAFERLERDLKRIPPRYVGVFMHTALGISALTQPHLSGGVFALIDKYVPFLNVQVIGIVFVLFAIITALVTDRRLYLLSGLLFLAFAAVGVYGAFVLNEVSYQSGILWLSVALYNLLSYVTQGVEDARN